MKKPINETAKLRRLAGLITESEYQEEVAKVKEESADKEKVEEISGEAFKMMDARVNRNHILSLLAAAEGIVGDLEAEGFDVEDIRDYINQIIVNDI